MMDELRRPNPRRWLLLVPVIAGLAFAGWWLFGRGGDDAPVSRSVRVERGEVRQTAEASGSIEPHVQVAIQSQAAGEVSEVLVEEGDVVQAGQVLFRLDARDANRALEDARVTLRRAQADVAQARANLAVAEAQAEDADATRVVSARSVERGLVSSESDRSAASAASVARATAQVRQAAVQSSAASLAAARLAVQDAEQRLTEMEIRAPVSGTILDVAVERGSIVASAISNVSGGTAMATLADLSDLRVVGAIDEAQIGRVAVGQSVEIRVDAYPDRTYAGRVERVAPLGVQESNVVTFDVEIVIDDEHASELRSGMSADLSIIVGQQEGILVPLVAIRSDERRRFVQLLSGDTRDVRTGDTDGRRIVVLEGLEEGDEIAIAPRVVEAAPERAGSILPSPRRRGGGGPPGRPPS